jgi:hypothetical protein
MYLVVDLAGAIIYAAVTGKPPPQQAMSSTSLDEENSASSGPSKAAVAMMPTPDFTSAVWNHQALTPYGLMVGCTKVWGLFADISIILALMSGFVLLEL